MTAPATARARAALARTGLPRKLKSLLADALVGLGRLPGCAPLGYRLYGALLKVKHHAPEVVNLASLDERLFRGGQPSAASLATLKGLGVTTVINLRREAPWVEPMVTASGLRYHHVPMPVFDAPSIELAIAFLTLATHPDNGTVFFHCYHGSDRTGALAAAYRMAVHGWTLEQAVDELCHQGFHMGWHDRVLDFLVAFDAYWRSLSASERARVLNREISPEAAGPAGP